MLAGSEYIEHRSDAMDLRRIIPSEITASAIAHLSLLTLLVLFSDVRPFGSVTAEEIPVEIVTVQDLAEKQDLDEKQEPAEQPVAEDKPEPTPTPQADFKPAAASAPTPSSLSPTAAPPQKQVALAAPAAAQPPAVVQPNPPAPSPGYKAPEPDLSIKYQVLLGLPPDLSPTLSPASPQDKADDNFDAPATESADIASNLVAEFRRHLKTCSKLPTSLTATDDVKVKLRVLMTPEGRLAAEPVLIEASASMKGPLLMQSAVRALSACQPYAMLPKDRYGEWKVLDLSFTPRDFSAS